MTIPSFFKSIGIARQTEDALPTRVQAYPPYPNTTLWSVQPHLKSQKELFRINSRLSKGPFTH
jgi:hypothetical protein